MSGENDYYNFLSQPTFSLSGQIGGWGRNAPNNGWGPLAENVQMGMYGDMSGWTPSERMQYDGMRSTEEFRKQMLANSAPVKPSPWVTGTETFGNIAQGLASLGNIYLGYQALKQQKKAFEFNKGVTNTNLNNAIADYNRRLGDTLTNRALNNGQGQGWVSDQLAKYSAKRS